MAKYRKPPEDITEEPKFFIKHYWHIASAWVVANRDNVLTGLLVVVIVILGVVVWGRYSSSRNSLAWGQVTLASTPAEIESAVSRYGGTPAGRFLKIFLADRYMNDGQFDKAAELYANLSRDLEFGDRARYSLAMSKEAVGKFDEAAAALKELAAGTDFWAEKARTALDTETQRRDAYASFEAANAVATASTASTLDGSAQAVAASTESALQGSAQAASIEPAPGEGAQATTTSTDSSATEQQ
jgi:hypothetical protein